jgi:hypothetical protein
VPHESALWRDAAGLSDYFLTLNPGQLDDLLKDLDSVIDRHRRSVAEHPAPDARQVLIFLAGIPRMDP